jgi:hypothetical protein
MNIVLMMSQQFPILTGNASLWNIYRNPADYGMLQQ